MRKSFDDAGFQPVTDRWLEVLSVFGVDHDTRRKKRIKELLLETNGENLPMKFDEFKPGKFIITLHYNLLI